MNEYLIKNTSKNENQRNHMTGIYLSGDYLDKNNILSSSEFLVFILDSIQDGVSILDTEMNIIYINRTVKYWYESTKKIYGKKCYEIYHNRKTSCEFCPVKMSIESNKPEMGVVPYQTKSKDIGWQELFSIPIYNKDKKIIGFLEYIRDISFQRYIEHKFSDLMDRFDNIEKKNDLLQNLLKQKEYEKNEIENTIAMNMEKYVKPSLEFLKKYTDNKDVRLVEDLIDEIVYPITKKRATIYDKFTSREMQIAKFIKDGKTSKEIATILCVTKKTVDFHRANIRRKLNLDSKKINLRTFLITHI